MSTLHHVSIMYISGGLHLHPGILLAAEKLRPLLRRHVVQEHRPAADSDPTPLQLPKMLLLGFVMQKDTPDSL